MSDLKYAWQQSVLDAFGASAESLPAKINIAQKAIAARQQATNDPDTFERLAISDALRALRKLIEQTRPAGHYHICWENGVVDWEVFGSRADAEASAKQLSRVYETYVIEKSGIDCPRCAQTRAKYGNSPA